MDSTVIQFPERTYRRRHVEMFDAQVLSRVVHDSREALIAADLKVEFSNDTEHLKEDAGIAGKAMSPLFDPCQTFLAPGSVLWGKATNHDGQIVHIQACRIDNTGQGSLADLLPNLFSLHYEKDEYPIDLKDIDHVRGNIVYHGDFWVASSGINQKAKVTEHLARLGMAQSALAWQIRPDWYWAVFEHKEASRGFAFRSGFHNITTLGTGWKNWLKPTETVGVLSSAEYCRQLKLMAQSLGQEPSHSAPLPSLPAE